MAVRVQQKIMERRSQERYEYVAPIILISDQREAELKRDGGAYAYARMSNYSASGIYFESDYELPAGSWIFFRLSNFLAGSRDFKELRGYGARIKWCRPLPVDQSFAYGIGAEFKKI